MLVGEVSLNFAKALEFDEQLKRELEADQIQLDRDWYDQEEFGAGLDEDKNPFIGKNHLPCSCTDSDRRRRELLPKAAGRDAGEVL